MTQQPLVDLLGMQTWARAMMLSRTPDFEIGIDYIKRWWIIPRNHFCNMYLHEITGSDDDRALHDHPWSSTSFIIEGEYIEHLPDGSANLRQAGDVVTREPDQLHRLEIPEGGRAVSLFITGPKVREWGFDCPQGWRHWTDFVGDDPGQMGRGCGE